MTSKQPLDAEAWLRKRKEEKEAASKIRFIPKAERERLAREKREKEEKQQKEEQEAKRAVQRPPPEFKKPDAASRRPTSFAAKQEPQSRQPSAHAAQKRTSDVLDPDAVARYERYYGPAHGQSSFSARKKRQRTAENKFKFDWDPSEDTSRPDDNSRIHGQMSESDYDARTKKIAQELRQNAVDPQRGEAQAQLFLEKERERKERRLEIQRDKDARQHDRKDNAFGKHWSDKPLEEMRQRDWRIFKEDYDISMKGGSLPNPMRSWLESGLPKRLLDVVAEAGYTDPSPIQRSAIPIALQTRDLIGVAATGSGKTAAFLLPLLVYISELPALNELTKNDGPYALILAPTRELAQQIEIEAKKFANPLGFTCVSIVGGHSLEEQAYNLRNGAEIVIATPGRLVDCIERRMLVLSQCCYVIMDEADRMIDLGFEEPVNKILDALPADNMKPDSQEAENSRHMSRHIGVNERYRQTMMYTATMPSAVERIARKYLRRPAIVTIGNIGEAVETVEQRVEFVSGEDRRKRRMLDILASGEFKPPIIVFVNIKRNCDAVARDIKQMGFSSVTLHGSKTQDQREAALAAVRNGSTDVLVATDLAGRGIDVPDVSLVLNFNMATSIESYTHRIGRTGRAGKSGVAITFLASEDNDVLYDLRMMLTKSSLSRVPDELRKHESAQQKPQRGQQRKVE